MIAGDLFLGNDGKIAVLRTAPIKLIVLHRYDSYGIKKKMAVLRTSTVNLIGSTQI
ncbi:MAG: hypothetical protein L6262_06450 [Weeksellaceae bacterium]|nr:hypothetical protein [Weeksellaceae bacterium]